MRQLAALTMMAFVAGATGGIAMEERPVLRRPRREMDLVHTNDLVMPDSRTADPADPVVRAAMKRARKAAKNRGRLPPAAPKTETHIGIDRVVAVDPGNPGGVFIVERPKRPERARVFMVET